MRGGPLNVLELLIKLYVGVINMYTLNILIFTVMHSCHLYVFLLCLMIPTCFSPEDG